MMLAFGDRRILYPALALFVCITLLYSWSYLSVRPTQHYLTGTGSFDGTWDYHRDAKNLLLTDAQCDAAFPGLFKEVDRAVEHRRKKHVTLGEMDAIQKSNGYVRGMIYDQQMYIIDQEGTFFSREYASIQAIHRAVLTSPESLPNIEFTFLTDDIVRPQAQWAYSRKFGNRELWLMPDFGFWSWPEPMIGAYSEVQSKAIAKDKKVPWKNKVPKLVWRGAILGLPIRQRLLEATEHKDWADIRTVDWHNEESFEHDRLTMDDHCQYKYLMHTEGTSNSGRLKYLQNCRSVVVAHKLEWVQHHHHLMVPSGPEQNFVEVERSFKNLEAKIKNLKLKDKDAEAIADRSVKVFRERYLTPAAETCYWRKLIRGWASVSFKPEFYNKTDGSWRGVPVESFLLERSTKWAPS